MDRIATAFNISDGIRGYLRQRYGGPLDWHPLFQAGRDLFCYLMAEDSHARRN